MPNVPKKGVNFCFYPKFLYAWPLIVVGFLCYAISRSAGPNADIFLGWVYTITVIAVVITMGVDLIFRGILAVGGLIAIVGLAGLVFGLSGYPVSDRILEFLRTCTPRFDPGGALLISVMFTIVYILMYIWTRLFQRVHVGPGGEVVVRVFGESDTKYLSDNRCFSVDITDVLERLLGFGAGQITFRDRTTGDRVVFSNIPHVKYIERTIDEQGLLVVEETSK